MKKVIVTLFLASSALAAVSGGHTCNSTLAKFNEKAAQLVENARNQTSGEWSVNSDVQSIKGLSFALKYTCVNKTLDVVATETSKSPSELKACSQLQKIVQSLLPKDGEIDYKGSEGVNKEVLTTGKELGANCTLNLVASDADEEEQEVEDEKDEDLGELATLNEEEDLSKAVEEEAEEVEESKYPIEDYSAIKDKYINKYKPKNVKEAEEEEDEDEEEDAVVPHLLTVKLISMNKKAKNDSGSQWTQGGYENYTNASQWQSGGFQKYYDQNKTNTPQFFF